MNPEKRFIALKTILLAANEVREFNIAGRYFRVKESTAPFSVQSDQGEFFDMEKGLGFGDENHPNFNSLFFKNKSSTAALEVTFFVSNVPIDDSRVTYVATRPERTYTIFAEHSLVLGTPVALLNSNTRAGKLIADSLAYVTIDNYHTSPGPVSIQDSTGVSGGTVYASGARQVVTSDVLYLEAEGATAIVRVAYFFNYDAP